MYRPLVQPKFYHSRGQKIGPSYGVLTAGGPKQRGQIFSPNPHLLDDADGWDVGSGFCAGISRADGHVDLTGLTGANCTVLRGTPIETLETGTDFEVKIFLPTFSADGGQLVAVVGGDVANAKIFDAPGRFVVYETDLTVALQEIELLAFNPVNMTARIEYFAVSKINYG